MLFKKLMRLIRVKRYARQDRIAKEVELNKALKQWGIDRY